jgi:hypothetical protein
MDIIEGWEVLESVIVEGQVESRRERERIEQKLELIRRRQERSLWSKARSSVKFVVESVRGVVGRLRDSL